MKTLKTVSYRGILASKPFQRLEVGDGGKPLKKFSEKKILINFFKVKSNWSKK